MFKTIHRWITAASLLLLTGIMLALAMFAPNLWFGFYTDASRSALRFLSSVTSVLPFCVWELLLVLLLVLLLAYLVHCILRHKLLRWFATLAEVLSLLLFLFVGLWGLNHFGPSLNQRLEINVRDSSVADLKAATIYYATMASQYSNQVQRDDNQTVAFQNFDTLSEQAVAGYAAMENPLFHGTAPRVKKLLSSSLFSYMGITGIFVDFTAEACVNTQTYSVSLPYTMCHELAHSVGIAAEEEANYCAFLVCENHSSPEFRYSGYYNAFIYCYNALYKADPSAANSVWDYASALLQEDCNHASAYYKQYEGEVQKVADKVNDTYLKAFSQQAGTQSYGLVADYLIAHYRDIGNT